MTVYSVPAIGRGTEPWIRTLAQNETVTIPKALLDELRRVAPAGIAEATDNAERTCREFCSTPGEYDCSPDWDALREALDALLSAVPQ